MKGDRTVLQSGRQRVMQAEPLGHAKGSEGRVGVAGGGDAAVHCGARSTAQQAMQDSTGRTPHDRIEMPAPRTAAASVNERIHVRACARVCVCA